MKYEYLHFDGATFKRINKKKAEVIYNYGYVRMIPIDEVVTGYPVLFVDVKKLKSEHLGSDLESVAQDYKSWLCSEVKYTKKDSEILFYIPIKLIDAFTGESPTKSTINTVETYDYEFFNFYNKEIPYSCTDY